MTKVVLELEGAVKRYGGVVALGPVAFSVQEGEFLTLLGPSGCGKTTTLHLTAGLLRPDAGRIFMFGKDITKLPASERGMGLVFQNYALFPHKTVDENVGFGLRMRRVPRREIAERVREMLEIVGLPSLGQRYSSQLSGGQRQRVALARALVIHPTVLLLDEPLSNLDALLRKRMRAELRAIQQQVGITAIYVTHDQEEAFEMSDRVILLNHGHIEQIGRPEEIYDQPASRFAAEFIGDANLVAGEITELNGGLARVRAFHNATVEASVTETGLQVGDAVYLVIRPERIHMEPDRPEAPQALSARVSERVFAGEMVRITLITEDGIELRSAKASLPVYRTMKPNDLVWISLEGCHAIPKES